MRDFVAVDIAFPLIQEVPRAGVLVAPPAQLVSGEPFAELVFSSFLSVVLALFT